MAIATQTRAIRRSTNVNPLVPVIGTDKSEITMEIRSSEPRAERFIPGDVAYANTLSLPANEAANDSNLIIQDGTLIEEQSTPRGLSLHWSSLTCQPYIAGAAAS